MNNETFNDMLFTIDFNDDTPNDVLFEAAARADNVIEEAPDYLHFNEHIFRTYFSGMTANGDEICYTTTFGLKFKTTGNTRPIASYLGFRICTSDGTAELVTQNYQISHASIQHHWREPWIFPNKTEEK